MSGAAPDFRLPAGVGVGYKAQHFNDLVTAPGCVSWLEIHAENYMGDGGRPLAQLRHLSERFPMSVHGVGLSIGGEAPLDPEHLARLKHLCAWLKPASFSEHLAWSTHEGAFLNDLLPLPYTEATLARVCTHIDQLQATIGRAMMLENPSTYLAFEDSDMEETDFLAEIARRTGCGLLLDVNNVYVACTNQQRDPLDYIEHFPLSAVHEIHLGGHDEQSDEHGDRLLIDSHDAEVVDPVWQLYRETIRLSGPRPTLIEWDADIPDYPTLEAEARRAAAILEPVPA
ncbi:DUF692 domain-containing protein [Vannielia litorea]|uniref:UPF0276 protein SAMN05444002_0659 n=1 Tax=Vannielia litorea TaxID=1217970 RepID=A0A1N6EE64_9RHOB|nr:DUF692 domain-containing protein [Vannielia litorea]SIN81296.1 hypothetical protein SAMN05444002_0659 [Vannielia litorea]